MQVRLKTELLPHCKDDGREAMLGAEWSAALTAEPPWLSHLPSTHGAINEGAQTPLAHYLSTFLFISCLFLG